MQYESQIDKQSTQFTTSPSSAERIAKTDVVCVSADASIDEVVQLMREHHIGDVVVTEEANGGRTPVGIVTDRDILLKCFSKMQNGHEVRVNDVMTPFVATARVHDDLFKLAGIMAENGVSRLPIVDDKGSLCGIVTAKKVFQYLVGSLNDLAGLSDQQRSNEKIMKH